MVSWIPIELAKRGLVVNLKDQETGEWKYGWTVLDDAHENSREFKHLNERSRDYKKTRSASDI